MSLLRDKGKYSALILIFGTEEFEQEIKKLIFVTQNSLESNFAGVQLVERKNLREFRQNGP